MLEYARMRIEGKEESASFDDVFVRVESGAISRRDFLRLGGVAGAGLAMVPVARAIAGPDDGGLPTVRGGPHDARVVIVGAGLAGMTAAYRLAQRGVSVRLFEARDRVGGRCWTARGFADGQTAEHGGEFIDSRHVHLIQLAKELHLELDDLFEGWVDGSVWLNYVEGRPVRHGELKAGFDPLVAAVARDAKRIGVIRPGKRTTDAAISYRTATPAAVELDALSMAEWLDRRSPGTIDTPLGHWLNEIVNGWYGLDLDRASAITWLDLYVIASPGADERWHVRGGNDQVPSRIARRLPEGTLELEAPLEAILRRHDGSYELRFTGQPGPVIADIAILTLPFTTLRRVDFSGAGFGAHTIASINELGMGTDGKLLLQYDRRPWKFDTPFGVWSGGLEHTDPNFETWESSTDEPGASGLITVYPGGRSGAETFAAPGVVHGPGPDPLVSNAVGWIDDAVPGTAKHFNGQSWVDWWTGDPWTLGAYAAFTPGQYTKYWHGVGKADGRVHFAGEHTSTYSQGFLNGGVESGTRAAIEVMRALGIRVPASLAALPYSTFN